MWAVGDVLGDAVTPEVAAAWDELLWLFGCQLIAEEGRLYALGGTDPEQPWRKYRVVERMDESPEIFSLVLARSRATPPSTGPASTSRSPSTCRAVSGSRGSTRSPPGREAIRSG